MLALASMRLCILDICAELAHTKEMLGRERQEFLAEMQVRKAKVTSTVAVAVTPTVTVAVIISQPYLTLTVTLAITLTN
jgi:hypothetical protein